MSTLNATKSWFTSHPAGGTWAVLMLASLLSFGFGDGLGPAKLATVACFIVAYAKVNLIGHSFMELHGAPKGLRIAFAGFTVFVGTVLIVLYLAKA
ncbi:MAG TPA: cytochrome C oxidase subunit IV family protein [Solirubrobacteraceae bacterium]|jgi:hypothetical protein|nr:cytochrome C oxidase subunit IV family protein [Solirubrobacteraceae bacterium]